MSNRNMAGRGPDFVIPKLRMLSKGENIVYHRGFLAIDRKNPNVRLIAAEALGLSDAGHVHLTQRRVDHEVFDYIATGA